MLKTENDHDIWLVQQHHHAEISGYLAAHWGGSNGFVPPGHFPGATQPNRWRDEVIVGIAEHDNGWWEWEANPKFSSNDGLPVGLGERLKSSKRNELDQWRAGGFDRWRAGIDRLAGPHPYGALMTSLHAYWLYAVEFDDLIVDEETVLRHFIFGGNGDAPKLVGDREVTRRFLDEQAALQQDLKNRLSNDSIMAGSTSPDHLTPHIRLLQLLDSLSLFMSLNDRDEHVLPDVPRSSWKDRTTIRWSPREDNTIALDPYPFAQDPLPVHLPARIVSANGADVPERMANPYATLLGAPYEVIKFTLTS